MKKELKDYLPFYLGCKCVTPFGIMYLTSIQVGKYKAWFQNSDKRNKKILDANGLAGRSFILSEIKLILRPLSDKTLDEQTELEELNNRHYSADLIYQAIRIKWYISKHFDIFNLKAGGLAVYKEDLK